MHVGLAHSRRTNASEFRSHRDVAESGEHTTEQAARRNSEDNGEDWQPREIHQQSAGEHGVGVSQTAGKVV